MEYNCREMKSRVYVETSIPSFYYQTREEPEMLARQQWTRDWWDNCSHEYSLVTSFELLGGKEGGDE